MIHLYYIINLESNPAIFSLSFNKKRCLNKVYIYDTIEINHMTVSAILLHFVHFILCGNFYLQKGITELDIDYFNETFHFSPDSDSPLYEQLASYIKIQIQAGVLKPGDQMITETNLCKILNISRTTVRQCMDRLVDEGLLVRYRGRGSFIADPKMKRNINYLYNFTENMKELGAVPTSIVIKSEVIEADQFIRDQLKLPPTQTKVFRLYRLRCANDKPILFEKTFIPYYLCERIEHFDFSSVSLYHVLSERYALNFYRATETIEAIIINKEDSELLKCTAKVPGYKIQRISYLDSGFIFEFTTSITRADRCVFQMELYKNTSASKNPVDIRRQVTLA